MKRSLLLVLVAMMSLLALPAEAQIRFGVKGGMNVTKISFNKDVVNPDNITGFNIGPMMEFRVPLVGIGMDIALLYSQKGLKATDRYTSGGHTYKKTSSMKTDYIDLPVNLKWKFGLPIVKFYLTAGPYLSFRVGGNKFWQIPGNTIDDLKAKNFGAGLNFGVGTELLNHLQVGFNYGLGLTDNYKAGDIDLKGKDRGWSISAAILF